MQVIDSRDKVRISNRINELTKLMSENTDKPLFQEHLSQQITWHKENLKSIVANEAHFDANVKTVQDANFINNHAILCITKAIQEIETESVPSKILARFSKEEYIKETEAQKSREDLLNKLNGLLTVTMNTIMENNESLNTVGKLEATKVECKPSETMSVTLCKTI